MLRFSTPVMQFRRTATEDIEIRGQTIRKGEKIVVYYGAANRDPSRFEDPDTYDITRANAREHLAFGSGIHSCLGNKLAKMPSATALRELATSMPDLRLDVDPDTIEFPDSISMRAPIAVPVTW